LSRCALVRRCLVHRRTATWAKSRERRLRPCQALSSFAICDSYAI
jgi:hypothetical protein